MQKHQKNRILKRISPMLLLMCFILLFTACSGNDNTGVPGEQFRVYFNLNYTTTDTVAPVSVESGKTIPQPANPERTSYSFKGWYTEAECNNKWEFDTNTVSQKLMLYAKWESVIRGEIVYPANDKNLTGLSSTALENAINYQMFFKPAAAGGHVGDVMPYYENGIYHIFYLQDTGGSHNHSIYRTDTTDFLNYDYKGLVLESSYSSTAQDNWIGTGSVVKAEGDYYFFYTGHNGNVSPAEKIMVAKSIGNMDNFQKVTDFEIAPSIVDGLNNNDFRDPQVFYNATNKTFEMIITARTSNNRPRIYKCTVSLDLKTVASNGQVHEHQGNWYNLECSDIFKIGETYYLTYSPQDDTLWYATSTEKYSGYTVRGRLDGKMFYAPKSVSNGTDVYMAGWARRRLSPNNNVNTAWAGHLVVQKVIQHSDGSLTLAPIDELEEYYANRRALQINDIATSIQSAGGYVNREVANAYESFMFKGQFKYTAANGNDFGLAFGYGGDSSDYCHIKISPKNQKIISTVLNGSTEQAEIAVSLSPNVVYDFTFIMEGSVGIFYLDGKTALTVRMYGMNNKKFGVFSDSHSVDFSLLCLYTRAE